MLWLHHHVAALTHRGGLQRSGLAMSCCVRARLVQLEVLAEGCVCESECAFVHFASEGMVFGSLCDVFVT